MDIDIQLHSAVPDPPPRPEDAHKGTFGTVIVVGGSETMIGAPAIAARGALRAGVGLVKLAMPGRVLPFGLTIEPSATGVPLPAAPEQMVDAIEKADPKRQAVLAVGPGLGTGEAAGEMLMALLSHGRRIVLDADAITLLAQRNRPPNNPAELVMTPHPGEFDRLAQALGMSLDPYDPEFRPGAAQEMARRCRCVVLLKGKHSVATNGDAVYINTSGNAALATAGTGDVLTGVIAALMARGMSAMDAASLGAYAHGSAADRWAEKRGPSGLLARELADLVAGALYERTQADSADGRSAQGRGNSGTSKSAGAGLPAEPGDDLEAAPTAPPAGSHPEPMTDPFAP
ncbi:MAG: NAD(P)H-hydrate dehydratase [Planctomycetota bacterium]